jgi:hypothetical protein
MTLEEQVDAKKLAHAPPVYLECDQAILRLGNPDKEDLNPITSGEQAGAKKLAHAPPVYLQSDQAASQLSNHDNHDLNIMTLEEQVDAKKLAHAPPVYFEPDQATPGAFRLSDPNNDDHHPMVSGEDDHVQNLSDMPPEPQESDRANPGAFRIGGQDNEDGNTVASGEEVRSHGVTTHTLQVSARLVEDDPEVDIVVAVVAKDERGNKKHLIISQLEFCDFRCCCNCSWSDSFSQIIPIRNNAIYNAGSNSGSNLFATRLRYFVDSIAHCLDILFQCFVSSKSGFGLDFDRSLFFL